MASSTIACNFHCNYHPSIPLPTSATPFSLSFSHPLICAYNGLSLHPSTSTFRVFAKFEKFQTESPEPDPPFSLEENTVTSVKDDEEDDGYYYFTIWIDIFVEDVLFCCGLCSSLACFGNLCVSVNFE